jgi:hypothetical protein
MGSKKSGKKSKPTKTIRRGKRPVALYLIVAGIVAAVVAGVFLFEKSGNETDRRSAAKEATSSRPSSNSASPAQRNLVKLIGRWLRPDGGYVIDIANVGSDGSLAAAYYNPRPINVAQASWTIEEERTKIFIELRDVGYPGARYSLAYDPQDDALKGLYYQPSVEQSFEVVFVRMNP